MPKARGVLRPEWRGQRALLIVLERLAGRSLEAAVPRFNSNPIDAIGLLVSESPPARPQAPGVAVDWEPPAGDVAPDGVAWAAAVLSRSMEQRDLQHEQILGAPDAYPRHDSSPHAWGPHHFPPGRRWIEVSFGAPLAASAVLVYESFHPGSVVAIEDLTGASSGSPDPERPVTLWEGHLPMLGKDAKPLPFPCWSARSRVLRVDWPAPRPISALRVVLDTRYGCYSQIDAVGLVPAGLPGAEPPSASGPAAAAR